MSADMSIEVCKNVVVFEPTWNQALIEAKQQLSEAEGRVKRLKETIKGIEGKIARGEPLP